MTAFFNTVKEKTPTVISAMRRFFEGKIYPAVIALAVLVGHISGLEFYLGIPIVLAVSLSLLICPTVKPLIPAILMFIYILNVKHTPGIPSFSNYYFEGTRLVILISAAAILLVCLLYFTVKRILPTAKGTRAPMLIPSVLFALALLLNGFLGNMWELKNLLFAALQVFILFVLFYLFYYGLRSEESEALIDYVIYVSILALIVLAGEMAFLLITSKEVINENGAILKEQIYLGWGISNSYGCCTSVLLPLPILGAARAKSKRYALPCFAAGILAFGLTVLSLCRNAILFAAIALVASLAVCCFFGEGRRMFRIVALIGIAAVGVLLAFFGDEIITATTEYISRDPEDSGRFDLWRFGFDIFKEYPLFGNGFYAYNEYDIYRTFDFMPIMAHNTVIQILSSMGIFGFAAYSAYRIATFIPILRKPSCTKIMLAAPIIILLSESLLDNFIFYIYMSFPYVILLALLFKISKEEREKKLSEKTAS